MISNYEELIELIKKAHGNRNSSEFARDCNIDSGHLSRVLKGKFRNPPKPDYLKKIADNSNSIVSHYELMKAAGYLENNFLNSKLALLRGEKTYQEYADYLMNKGSNICITAKILEAYEKNYADPKQTIIEEIAEIEGIDLDYFYENHVNNEIFVNMDRSRNKLMNEEIKNWIFDPENFPYIEFIYNAYKAGIPKELLNKAEISIKIK